MSETFLNLLSGNTLKSYLGHQTDDTNSPNWAPDYTYIQVPLKEVYNPSDEKIVTKAMRNQQLKLIPACTINVRSRYKAMVKTNPKLQEVATCPTLYLIDGGDSREEISFYATFRKDYDLSELEWIVRVYLIG